MSEGYDVAERAVEICKHTALLCAGNAAIECSANLSLSRIKIDPRILESFFYKIVNVLVYLTENGKENNNDTI